MNFLPGEARARAVELGRFRLELPETVRRRLPREPAEVLARPAAGALLRRASRRDAGPADDPGDLEVTEQLGPETVAYFRIEGVEAEEIGERPVELERRAGGPARSSHEAAAGEPIELATDLEGAQLFDPAPGESLLARTTASP